MIRSDRLGGETAFSVALHNPGRIVLCTRSQ